MLFTVFLAMLAVCLRPCITAQVINRIMPAVLGSSVTLDCTVPRAPGSYLIWEKMDPRKTIAINNKLQSEFVNSNTISVHSRGGNMTSLELTSMSLAENGEYRCYDVGDLATINSFDVSILVRPFAIQHSPLVGQIDEATTQTITCVANGGKPTPIIEWYLLGPDVNRTKLTGHEDARQYPNGTWYKKSNLTFTVTRAMYRASIFCLVNTGPIPFYNESLEIKLDVNLAPLTPAIGYFTGLFNDGETKTITCTSAGSRPAATVDWYLDGAKLDNTIHEVLPRSDGTFFVTGIISLTFFKGMNGRPLRCSASNSVVINNGVGQVSRSVTLLVTYPPKITSENGTREVMEGSDVVLTCLVDARPMPIPQNIFWRQNNNIINIRTASRFNYTSSRVADMHISSVRREDIGDYKCQALNTIGSGTGQKVHLEVLYRPVCKVEGVARHAVRLSGSVEVTCTVEGNPGNATIVWRYKGTGVTIRPTRDAYTVYGRPRETTSITVISVTKDWQYTDVECVGTNAIGVSTSPCIYKIVRPGPPEIPTNCSSSTVSDRELQVECTPGFDGGSDQYFVLQQSKRGSHYVTTLNDTSAVFLVTDLESGTGYMFKLCAVSELYPELLSCSSEISAKTFVGITNKQALATAGSPDSAGYIAGGVLGGLVLIFVIGVIIFAIRKRRQPTETSEESMWNQNRFIDTSRSNYGGISYLKEKKKDDGVPKTISTRNTNANLSNNQFARTDEHLSLERRNSGVDFDPMTASKVTAYAVVEQSPMIHKEMYTENHEPETAVVLHTHESDDIDTKDFHTWFNGNPGFGKSSRHDLCYSEADISTITVKPTCVSSTEKSLSLDNMPSNPDLDSKDPSMIFQTNPSVDSITVNDSNVNSDSFCYSSLSSYAEEGNLQNVTTPDGKDSSTDKGSDYKPVMHDTSDSILHNFYSASVEALSALDATLADELILDCSHERDSYDSPMNGNRTAFEGESDGDGKDDAENIVPNEERMLQIQSETDEEYPYATITLRRSVASDVLDLAATTKGKKEEDSCQGKGSDSESSSSESDSDICTPAQELSCEDSPAESMAMNGNASDIAFIDSADESVSIRSTPPVYF